jgi:hypothetical protein
VLVTQSSSSFYNDSLHLLVTSRFLVLVGYFPCPCFVLMFSFSSDILLGLDPNFVEDPNLRLSYDPAFLRTNLECLVSLCDELGFDTGLFTESQFAAAKDSMMLDTAIGTSRTNDEALPLPEDDVDMSITSSGSLKRKSETSDSAVEPRQKKRRMEERLDLEKLNFTKDAKGAVGCCFCLASFDTYSALEFHLCKYHNLPMPPESVPKKPQKKPSSKASFTCFFCDKVTATASGRRKHMKNVHGYQKRNEVAGGVQSSDSS